MTFAITLNRRIQALAHAFETSLPDTWSMDAGSLREVAGRRVPTMRNGAAVLNADFSIPDRFTADHGANATIFVRDGDDFVRITTSVRKQDGERAVGTQLDRSHPAYRLLLAGESYTGYATIFGIQHMTRYDPVTDASGRVIGVRYVGLNVADLFSLSLAARIALSVGGAYAALFLGYRWLAGSMLPGGDCKYLDGFGVLSCALVSGLVYWLVRRHVNLPMLVGKAAAQTIAGGDLSAQAHVDRRDDIGEMLQAINGISVGLTGVVDTVRRATDGIHVASGEIASGNADLSARTEAQAASLEETASAMEELTATVRHNADSAREADQLVASVSALAAAGGEAVGRVVDTMGKIKAGAKRIEDIVGIIDGIAFQTNILALNASVEAARAGEQGRGFAVVASEVRALAQRSAAASKEIGGLVAASVESVNAGNALVADAGKTMGEIVESVRKAAALVNGIATASGEQTRGIEEVNLAIGRMDEMTQQNAALVEQASAAATQMRDQAASLARAVATFRTAG
ncbi:MAG: Cache 3/Cache 2 fusion domain-containing protein [Burkholderiaceae bacterium]